MGRDDSGHGRSTESAEHQVITLAAMRQRLGLWADLIQVGQGVGLVLAAIAGASAYLLQLPTALIVFSALAAAGLGIVLTFAILSWGRNRNSAPRAIAPSSPRPPDPGPTEHERKIETIKRALNDARSDEVRATERRIDELHIDSAIGTREQLVEIGLADPPDSTVEPYLEWPHLAVKNTSATDRLLYVRAEVLITSRYGSSGTVLKLRWDPDDEPLVVLEARETRTIPLLLRSREIDKVYNTGRRGIPVHLAQWECYVTHEGFLLNGDTGLRVPPGDSDLRIRVTNGQDGSVDAWFRAYVPRVAGKPMWIVPLPATRGER